MRTAATFASVFVTSIRSMKLADAKNRRANQSPRPGKIQVTILPVQGSPMGENMQAESRPHPMRVHFSSETDMWSTPDDLYQRLNDEFHFETDVCAIAANAKCSRFFTPEEDGLKQDWTGILWMNPPYGRQIGAWVQKAHRASRQGATVCCLLPCRTDTVWWHRYVTRADEVRLLKGRLKFGGSKNSAPFPSAIVIFRPPGTSRKNNGTIPNPGAPVVDAQGSFFDLWYDRTHSYGVR